MKRAKKLKYHRKRRRAFSLEYEYYDDVDDWTEYGFVGMLSGKDFKDVMWAMGVHSRSFAPTWTATGELVRPVKKFLLPKGALVTIRR